MHIDAVILTTPDPDAAGEWFHHRLGARCTRHADRVDVGIGRSVLAFRPGPAPEPGRAHHVAFSIAPRRFDDAVAFLRRQVELITEQGPGILTGPPEWNSRSAYFWGPDGANLELIARSDLAGEQGSDHERAEFGAGDLLDISEVALAVIDARVAADDICGPTGLVPFAPVTDSFLPVGDQHGLLILVDTRRAQLPTTATRTATSPLEVTVTAPRPSTLAPAPWSILRVRGGDDEYVGPNRTQ